jgi:hypothetical protein
MALAGMAVLITSIKLQYEGFDKEDSKVIWLPPETGGLEAISYDVITPLTLPDFLTTASTCLESDDASDTEALVSQPLPPGGILYILVRAQNHCGQASLTISSNGVPRAGRSCP